MSEFISFLRLRTYCLLSLTGFLLAPISSVLAQEENAELDSAEPNSVEPVVEAPAVTPAMPEVSEQVNEAPVAAAATETVSEETAEPKLEVQEPLQTPSKPEDKQTSLETSAPRKIMFGSYRIRMSVNKPTFNDDLKFYDDLYGNPKNYGMFGVDWFAWDWYVTMGLGLRSGFYGASGERVKGGSVNKQNPDSSSFEKTGKTSLTMIPMQALITMEFSPFQRKWLVIDGWFGAEYAYWQEVRIEKASPTTTTTKSAVFAAAAAAASDDGSLTNKGWAKATVLGFAANILLNPLDDRSTKSMEATMGLGYVYLSPFMEVVTGINSDGINWGRKVIGLGFTFESIK